MRTRQRPSTQVQISDPTPVQLNGRHSPSPCTWCYPGSAPSGASPFPPRESILACRVFYHFPRHLGVKVSRRLLRRSPTAPPSHTTHNSPPYFSQLSAVLHASLRRASHNSPPYFAAYSDESLSKCGGKSHQVPMVYSIKSSEGNLASADLNDLDVNFTPQSTRATLAPARCIGQ